MAILSLRENLRQVYGLTLEELDAVIPIFQFHHFSKGQNFIRIGEIADRIGFIVKGYTREYFYRDYREVTKFIGMPGDFICDVAGLNFHLRSRWNIVCLTDCEIYTLHRNDVSAVLEAVPRWTEMEKKFNARCFVAAENRIMDYLQYNAEERYLKFLREKGEAVNHVPLSYIASYLGITLETLSRLRKKLSG